MTTYECSCGTRTTTSDDLPTCVECGGFLFPEDVTARLRVGDRVLLHHAKSKDRKAGEVVEVRRTRAVIRVSLYGGEWHTETTRKIDDPDVLVVR